MHNNPEIDTLLRRLHHPALGEIMPGLERMQALMAALGNPEQKLPPVIHVAGTNGKGSVCAYLTAILQNAGLCVHRYTSPHLVRFNERIMLANEEISDETILSYQTRIDALSTEYPATFFEATTALAFLAFADTPADVCILEVGLGGRLDATNIIEKPLLSVITPVSIDHMEYLGHTLTKIAMEKAGIMKSNIPCVIGKQSDEVMRALKEHALNINTPTMVYGEQWQVSGSTFNLNEVSYPMLPSLTGTHQYYNAGVALAVVSKLQGLKPAWGLDIASASQALPLAKWPARLQLLHTPHPYANQLPTSSIWLDGGHNEAAAIALAAWLRNQPGPRLIIMGLLKDKDAEAFIQHLSGVCEAMIMLEYIADKHTHASASLAHIASRYGVIACHATTIDEAMEKATRSQYATALICGSLYLARDVLNQSGT